MRVEEHACAPVALAVGAVLAMVPFATRAATVEVVVSGVAFEGGGVFASLCSGGLDETACRVGQRHPADAEAVAFVFSDVEPGRYAAVAFQDADGTGVLRRSRMGRPLEPYGLSNDAGRRRRPTFDQASVSVGTRGARISIRLDAVSASP